MYARGMSDIDWASLGMCAIAPWSTSCQQGSVSIVGGSGPLGTTLTPDEQAAAAAACPSGLQIPLLGCISPATFMLGGAFLALILVKR